MTSQSVRAELEHLRCEIMIVSGFAERTARCLTADILIQPLDNFLRVGSHLPTTDDPIPENSPQTHRPAPIILPLPLRPLDRNEHAATAQHSLKMPQDFVPHVLFNNVLKDGDGEDGVEALVREEVEIIRETKVNIWQ